MTQFCSSLDEIRIPDAWRQNGSWLSIGTFDGVHLGHQALIQHLVVGAHAENKSAILITFFPHPATVLRKQEKLSYLTSIQERSNLLNQLGIDEVITLSFNLELASLSAFDFMNRLEEKLNFRYLLVGFNFALGRKREGDLPALERIGEQVGYKLKVIPPIKIEDTILSSSQIRAWLTKGEVGQVAKSLGRWYAVTGKVIHGDSRGHLLGFPTANLGIWAEKALPCEGVYASWAWVRGDRWQAVVNIGMRPTFEAEPVLPRIEVHLIDFEGDLYGEELRIEFIARLRNEQRFSSPDLLQKQVNQDKEIARDILKSVSSPLSEGKIDYEN